MAIKMNGKEVADNFCLGLKSRCDVLRSKNIIPKLDIITTGDDSASKIYVRNKIKRCNEIGIEVNVKHFDSLTCYDLRESCGLHPIIVQEPITGDVTHKDVSLIIHPLADVDGFSVENMGLLASGYHPYNVPCTPAGVMRLLMEYDIPLKGKSALVIGRSNIVGRPMAMMLEHAGCTVSVAHSNTDHDTLISLFTNADIVVSAVGKRDIITIEDFDDWCFIKMKSKTIIDVGINRDEEGHICGDFSEELKQMSAYYTPTPGGTGPMTVAMLMKNVIEFYEKNFS